MSASLVTVVPDPSKAHLHGGRFGPEGGPLAAVAYVVGIILLFGIYGGLWGGATAGIETWTARLELEAAAAAALAADVVVAAAASGPGIHGSF